MNKWQNPEMLDQALEWVKFNTSHVVICTDLPKTYKDAMKFKLGSAPHKINNLPEDYDVGRQIIVPKRDDILISVKGEGFYYALVNMDSETLLFVTELDPPKKVDVKDKSNIAEFRIRLKNVE